MVELERNDYCAFHFKNPKDGECANCGLNICSLDQDYDSQANRLCKLCFNITKAKPRIKMINYSLWAVVIAAVIIIWTTVKVEGVIWYAMLPLILILVVPYFMRPFIMKLYFKDLEPKESILPILRYFEASGNLEHYKLFLKFAKNMTEEEITSMEDKLYAYLVPSLSFNYSKLPEEWQKDITKNLKISEEKFVEILAKKYRGVLLQTAVHNAQPNISKFIFYLSEIAEDEKLVEDYIKEITSQDILKLNDEEVNIIYKNLLEELYLFDESFFEYCDKLGLDKEKELITQLIARFIPPPVPKTQIEAVMTSEQLIEKRKKEGLKPEKPLSEGDAPEVEFSEEK